MDRIKSCTGLESIMRINWHMLDWCNYQCKYCSAGNAVTKDFANQERITKQHKIISSRLKLIDVPFEICLTGGEPTLHPNLKEIIYALDKNKNLEKIFLFTNLSRSVNYFKELQSVSHKLIMHGSYHPDYYTSEFLDKCKQLKCEVHVSLLDDKSYWDDTEQFIKDLIDNNIDYRLNVLSTAPNWKPNYPKEFWSRFKPYVLENFTIDMLVEWADGTSSMLTEYDLEEQDLNQFKGYMCTPQSYQIETDGTVRNVCTGHKMPLNLNSNNIVRKIKCPVDICSNGLIMYPKELDNVG